MVEDKGPTQEMIWEKSYSSKRDFFGNEPSEFGIRSAEVLKRHNLKKLLELGCGQGRDTVMFLKNGFEVTAIDYCQTGLDQLQECTSCNGLIKNLRLCRIDAKAGLPFPDSSFDAVYSHMFFTMEFTEEEMGRIMDEVKRVLRPGGYNIYSVRSDKDPHYGKGKHCGEDMYQNQMGFIVHFFTEEKIKRLSKGWEILSIRQSVEGSYPFDKYLYEVTMRRPR
ncbi:MAG: class I SAM-dependent methyltransferase [Methanomassiliicoccales archaeon]|nr:MAG: class I SAM-dependent methyltransferase [Methanomassiliicoccales archaeon]